MEVDGVTAGLVGRDREIEAIEAALSSARERVGSITLIEGAAGIGKTRLAQEADVRASRLGIRVLRVTGTPLESDLVLAGVLEVFGAVVADSEDPALRGAAANAPGLLAGDPGSVEDGGDSTARLFHSLHWLVANMAEDGPLAILVDDLQWVDPPSQRFLAYLARRIEDAGCALLATVRTGDPGADRPEVGMLRSLPQTAVLTPQALGPEEVEAIVRKRLPSADGAFVEACRDVSEGNPEHLEELLEAVSTEGMAPDADAARKLSELGPASLARTVLTRIAVLGFEAAQLARAAAVLGDGAGLVEAAELADLDRQGATRAADSLAAARVLDPSSPAGRLSFVHPLVREAVEADRSDADRARSHLAAARLLHRTGEDPEIVASHLLRSEPAGEPWAVEALRESARRHRGRGDPAAAVRSLERALDDARAGTERTAVLRDLGSAQALVHEPAAVESLREAWETAEPGPERTSIALELGRALLMLGRLPEGVEVCDEAIEAGAAPEEVARLELDLIVSARLNLPTRKLALERAARLRDHPPPAGSLEEKLMLANLAYETVLTGRSAPEAADLARRALEGGELLRRESADSPAVYLATNTLTLCEAFADAGAAFAAAIEDAERRGSALAFAMASCFAGDLATRSGDLEAGARHADASVEAAEAHGWELGLPAAVAFLADAHLEMGDADAAAETLRRAPLDTEAEIPDSVFFDPVLHSRACLRLQQGRAAEALADLREVGRRQQAWLCPNPSVIPWRSRAAEALLALGETEESAELAEAELADAERFGAPRALTRSRRIAALCAASPEETLDRLEGAVRGSEEAPLERARLLVDLGSSLRRSGRRRDSREPLGEALDLARRHRARGVAAAAMEELRASGARPRREARTGADSLTPSERRVAEMAATGLSNPEIAQALFVTRRTVETHLTSAYRKLEVSSREKLSQALDAGGS